MAVFTNQATLSYGNVQRNSNVVTGELLEQLSATKTAVATGYGAGDTVPYIISIVNSGNTPFTGLTITDNLGAYTPNGTTVNAIPLDYVENTVRYLVNGAPEAAPTVARNGNDMVISGLNIPAGGNATIFYEATVNNSAPLEAGSTINNVATVTGAGLTEPITLNAAIDADEEADLTISKSVCPGVVTENGTVTYTFVIQNSGNTEATAADNVIVSDTFDPILNPITVTLDGQTLNPDQYTYNTATGEFATNAGAVTVPAATYTQDPTTGIVTANPGVAVLTVSGTV